MLNKTEHLYGVIGKLFLYEVCKAHWDGTGYVDLHPTWITLLEYMGYYKEST